MGKLTARRVETLKLAGRHSDGGNLYLNIAKGGSKSWVLLYRYNANRKEMGLGSAGEVTLAEARKRALEANRLLGNGKDPLAEKQVERRSLAAQTTFGVSQMTISNCILANSKTRDTNSNGKKR